MPYRNITTTCPIENRLVLKSLKKQKMEKSISMKMKTVKDSTAKPNVKPPPGDISVGFETAICFYEIEDGDKTE